MRDEDPYTTASTTAVDRENQEATGDPVTGQPRAHPVGTGVGAATGGTVGAVIGSAVGGPVGAMVGAAVGGIAGGLAGKGIAESVNPIEEDAFWRDHYSMRPYASGRSYEDLQPAYRYGWESRTRYENRSWNDVESDLEHGWIIRCGSSSLSWKDAREAVRDAWNRVEGNWSTWNRADNDSDSGRSAYGSGKTEAAGYSYEDYRPAYWYGWEAGQSSRGRSWEAVQDDLERGWDQARGESRLSWIEAREAVRDAWNHAASVRSDQLSRSPAVEVPLQEFHDETGRLHAGKIADYLHIPLKQFVEALGKNYATVHKTPSGASLQPALQSIKRTIEILEQVLGNRVAVRAWLNSPHPDLGRRTPLNVILEGRPQAVEEMLEAALWGLPT